MLNREPYNSQLEALTSAPHNCTENFLVDIKVKRISNC